MQKPKHNPTINPLPLGLENLLTEYVKRCRCDGLRESSIALYQKEDRWFLQNLAVNGCATAAQITAAHVAAACVALQSKSYLSTVKTFLRFLYSDNHTNRDYSAVVPPYKRPQPYPSVYSEEEVQRFEKAVRENRSKRDYALVLLATRLGIRSGDISRLTFDDVDFSRNTIRIIQQKTDRSLELPLLPELRFAILDYVQEERPRTESRNIFVGQIPPHNRLSIMRIGGIVRLGITKAGIDAKGRGRGPHAFRSSLASSMVNDNVPYEVIRKTLGHVDPNAIKSYARLDVERLRTCALCVPEASGGFAEFLNGRGVLR